MEEYSIGSKIVVNEKEFEIMDMWEGDNSISEDGENLSTEIYFPASLRKN